MKTKLQKITLVTAFVLGNILSSVSLAGAGTGADEGTVVLEFPILSAHFIKGHTFSAFHPQTQTVKIRINPKKQWECVDALAENIVPKDHLVNITLAPLKWSEGMEMDRNPHTRTCFDNLVKSLNAAAQDPLSALSQVIIELCVKRKDTDVDIIIKSIKEAMKTCPYFDLSTLRKIYSVDGPNEGLILTFTKKKSAPTTAP